MKEIETVVSENIKRLLKEKNINQNELAKIAGVSESTVGKWVLEKSSPRMGAIQKISDYFRIPKNYILKEEESEYKLSSNQYTYFPTAISAGLPLEVDGITESSKITVSDEFLGKWANNKNIYFAHINGDSMNRLMADGSLIAIKPVSNTD